MGDITRHRTSATSSTLEAVERAEERLLEAQSQLTSAEGERDEKLEQLQRETEGLINRRDVDEKTKRIADLLEQLDAKSHELNELRHY